MTKQLLLPLSILLLLGIFFTQNAIAQTYCTSKANAPWNEWIANVQIGTLNNASQKEGYGNFVNLSTDIVKGTNYTLNVTQGFSWAPDPSNTTQQGRAWMDLNRNGIFEDTEIVATFTRNATISSITIPTTAPNGATRLRISLKTIGLPTACETFDKGEVEDYTVNITGGGVVNTGCRAQDSLELIRFYNATGGPNWTNKWNFNTPINTWYGVYSFTPEGCVRAIELNQNNLVGLMPDIRMANLEEFRAIGNQLSGTIPNLSTPNLTVLFLSNNLLSGSIPNFNMPKLEVLQLYGNQLTGTIPNFNMPNMRQFSLGQNRLTGAIPNFNFPNVAFCNLNDNQLSGAIPNFNFGNSLLSLTLQNNQLSGCIPLSLRNQCGRNSVTISNNPNLSTQDFDAFCSASNTGACTGGATCFNKFQMVATYPTVGQCFTNETYPSEYGTLQMLGARIADGFAFYANYPNNYGLSYNYFTKQAGTTTPPAGISFRNCTGVNWTYFVVQGFSHDERFSSVIGDQYYRVGVYGAETNPDSIVIETSQVGGLARVHKSVSKSLNCSPCVTNDRVAPVINCPTTTITYSQPFSPDALRLSNIVNIGFGTPGTNIQVTDNCNQPMIGFQYINGVYWGGVYPISLVAYDSAGNKTACNFNLKIPCSSSVSAPFISNCPTNISLQAAAGQTCATATWIPPTAANGGSPTRLTSNFTSGTCFPIGTTAVIYTARDSCGNATTCTFNVTVTGGTTGGADCASKGTAPWEYAIGNVSLNTLNNTSDKFKDINTLGYSDYTNLTTTLNKGQSYPLSITPLLSWIGNLPNAYCRVWIDFNQNKTFEANELVLEKTNANPLTQSVLIPSTALTGNTRMRVSLKNGAYPTACETFEKGEVEDYTVNIQSGGVVLPCDPKLKCPNDTTIVIPPTEFATCQSLNNKPPTFDVPACGTFVNSLSLNQQSCLLLGVTPLTWTINFSNGSKASCTFNVTVQQQTTNNGPDLTLANLTVSNPSVQQGQVLSFKADFKNVGNAPVSGNFSVKSYLSTNPLLDASDYQDGIITTGNYAAGFSVLQVPAAMTVRNTVTPGQYYLILRIDANDEVIESSENNNYIVSTGLITVTGTTGGGSDIGLSLTSTPSVYRPYTTQNFRITAFNSGTTAFSNVKIKFTRPALTSSGGTKVASIGTFQDYCPGGIECSEWTIPTLAGGATATLDAPVFILAPIGAITATATLLSSTPTDNIVANNTASVTINSATAPIAASLIVYRPTQLIPIVIQKLNPTLTEGEITLELESLIEKTVDFGISNAMGQQVMLQQIAVERGMNKVGFDVSQLPQGLYFIQTNVGKGRNVPTKFIKL
jgi:hypothetical protein